MQPRGTGPADHEESAGDDEHHEPEMRDEEEIGERVRELR
jgi:hypothetical protein